MNWDSIIGQNDLKTQLQQSIKDNRVGHALLFTGNEGYGVLPLVLAFCKEIFINENPDSGSKIDHLSHLDLHFSFPTYSVSGKSLSKNFIPQFRELAQRNPYFDYEDWSNELYSENKQLFISVDEIEELTSKLMLKSYEGGYKILVIWRADKMNVQASNKFLKLLEEPPKKTIIILTSESQDSFLQTILSRTQIYDVPRIKDEDIKEALLHSASLDERQVEAIIYQAQGNWNTAVKLLEHTHSDEEFEHYFVKWVRDAFQVKKKPQYLREIIHWAAEISLWNKEKQKQFLEYCTEIFRLAMLQNYSSEGLVYKRIDEKFNWEKFSEFIHGANIEAILEEISEANLHLTRNGNAKIVWTDLGIKLSRYIHKKA